MYINHIIAILNDITYDNIILCVIVDNIIGSIIIISSNIIRLRNSDII